MINHHSIAVNAPVERIFEQLLIWGESKWWPAGCPMRYTRLTDGEIGVGTRYRQKVERPLGPEWEVEVVSVTRGREVSRRFIKGMFTGVERLYIIREKTGSEVHYMMDFEVPGAKDRFLWNTFYKARHDENVAMVLAALKRYLEGSGKPEEVEEHPSTAECAARREFLRSFIKR